MREYDVEVCSEECGRTLSDLLRRYADRRETLDTPDVPFSQLDYMADRAAALEREVKELRALRDLVTEAARVTFANDQPHEYPLSVWCHRMPVGHPYTWGATLTTMNERGGRVTPEVIAHALQRLREVEEDHDE